MDSIPHSEASDFDMATMRDMRQYVHDSGNPMRFPDERGKQASKRRTDAYSDAIDNETRHAKAFKDAVGRYQPAFGELHDKHASGIPKGEDTLPVAGASAASKAQEATDAHSEAQCLRALLAKQRHEAAAELARSQAQAAATLAAAVASAASKNQEATDAYSEAQCLQALLANQQHEAAAELARSQAQHAVTLAAAVASAASKDQEATAAYSEAQRLDALLAKQQHEAAAELARFQAQAAVTLAAAVATAPGLPAADSLDMIITDVTRSLAAKTASLQAAQPAAPAVQRAAPAVRVWIRQTNANPSYNTTREITYRTPSLRQLRNAPSNQPVQGAWFYDASDKTSDPTTASLPVEMTDPATIAALMTLGTFTPARKQFKPKVGKKCTYAHTSNTYEVEVVRGVTPWAAETHRRQAPTTQPAPAVGKQVLLEGPFFRPGKNDVDRYVANMDTTPGMSEIAAHKKLAELATLWSSHSRGFVYDELQTTLWVKPKWLAIWLDTLKFGDHEIRVVGHGVRGGNFDHLAKDPRGFNLAKCNPAGGAAAGDHSKGFGIYCSPVDSIPAEYTSYSRQHKLGTMVLGLLQVPKPEQPTTATNTAPPGSYNTANGALEFYRLNGSRPANYIAANGENDAYNVRDQTLFLPLGVVVPK